MPPIVPSHLPLLCNSPLSSPRPSSSASSNQGDTSMTVSKTII